MAHGPQKPSQRFTTVNEQAVHDNLWALQLRYPPDYPTIWVGEHSFPMMQVIRNDYETLGLSIDRVATEEEITTAFRREIKSDVHPDHLGQKGLTATEAQSERLRALVAAKDRLLEAPEHPYSMLESENLPLHEFAVKQHQKSVADRILRTREFFSTHKILGGWMDNFRELNSAAPCIYFNTNHLSVAEQQNMLAALECLLKESNFTVKPYSINERYDKYFALVIEHTEQHATAEMFRQAGLSSGSDIMKLLDEGTTLKAAMEAAALARAARLPPRPHPIDDRPPDLPLPPPKYTSPSHTAAPDPLATGAEARSGMFSAESWGRLKFWEGWDPMGAASRGLTQARAQLPEAPWKGWEMPSLGIGRATAAGHHTGSGSASASASRPSNTISASSTTSYRSAPSSHSPSYGTTATREAEGGKAGMIALGVGAAAAGGWVLWEMSKREEKQQAELDTAPSLRG